MINQYLKFNNKLKKKTIFHIIAAMKRVACLGLLLLLFMPLAAREGHGENEGLQQLRRDFSTIICRLLACYEQSRAGNFLALAVHFSDLRTHPLWDLAWGRSRQTMTAEQRLLDAASRYQAQFRNGACPAGGGEENLCHLALEYIRAADRTRIPAAQAPLTPPDKCGLGQIQKNLTGRQVLLKYVLLEDRMLLFFVTARDAGYEFLPVATKPAVAMVNRLAEPLEDFALGRVDYLRIHFDMELAQRLYNIFLKSVAERFPAADELFIIPDQVLFKLPFEALVMGFNKNIQQDDVLFSEYQAADYVIQKFAVSYYLSLADFLRPHENRGEHRYALAAFGQPLVNGSAPDNAKGGRSGVGAIAEIPSTRLEIMNMGKIFSGARRRLFLGADFNRENFSRYAPQAGIVHIATHFFYDAADPSRSAFLFSAAGAQPSLCDARQIQKLRLSAELVILSACETSEKDLMGFRLLGGMTAAFRRSGVRALITSLWPVDELSSQIVPLFYREYLKLGTSAAALRNAKMALFGRTIPLRDQLRLSLAHPFLWANYVLVSFCR